jgi:membrane-bound metal-dependent hydrolase YbcI (DUF457 family)
MTLLAILAQFVLGIVAVYAAFVAIHRGDTANLLFFCAVALICIGSLAYDAGKSPGGL